jgi:hypothetical protein
VFAPISGAGGGAVDRSVTAGAASTGAAKGGTGFSTEARNSRPAAVICQPVGSRKTNRWLKMLRSGARAAMRFVLSVRSRPLEIRKGDVVSKTASGSLPHQPHRGRMASPNG